MLYRALSPTGDYTFGFGRGCFISDDAAVAQAVQTKLTLFTGDFWENLNDGLPFFQEIAGSSDKALIDLLYQSRILQVPNVVSIASFSSNIDAKRVYTAQISVKTSFGTTVEVTI